MINDKLYNIKLHYNRLKIVDLKAYCDSRNLVYEPHFNKYKLRQIVYKHIETELESMYRPKIDLIEFIKQGV